MKFSPNMLLVAGLVVAVAVLVVTRPDGADVALARKQTQQAIANANTILAQNKNLKSQADSARAEAASHEQKAQQAQTQLSDAKRALFKAALAAPDTCGPVVLAAQNALADADRVIDERTAALAAMTVTDLKDKKRSDDAEKSLADLSKPAQTLVDVTDNSLLHRLARLRPTLHAGAMAGVDVTGKPNAVVGIGFGWSF